MQSRRAALLVIVCAVCASSGLVSCTAGGPAVRFDCDPAEHAMRFRKTRSLHELQGLLPALELGLPRERVEGILGTPDYCPTEHQCYYASGSRNSAGVPYGLVVDYELLDPSGRQSTPVHGRLESIMLMAIGE